MSKFNCCKNARWVSHADLGHADSFDLIIGKCSVCNKYWANVFCTPTAITGYEKIKTHDVERLLLLNKTPGKELKEAVSNWLYENT